MNLSISVVHNQIVTNPYGLDQTMGEVYSVPEGTSNGGSF